jgi:hypothetical protein
MKRRLLWLALPLVLLALVLGVKWRAEHPTPTKEDLEIRAVMAQASKVVVTQWLVNESQTRFCGTISSKELAPFADAFYTLPYQSLKSNFATGASGILNVEFQFDYPRTDYITSIDVSINAGSTSSYIYIHHLVKDRLFDIHPVMTKRWMELLLEHPQIGAALREQAKVRSF